jgi:hypothetical protein
VMAVLREHRTQVPVILTKVRTQSQAPRRS